MVMKLFTKEIVLRKAAGYFKLIANFTFHITIHVKHD